MISKTILVLGNIAMALGWFHVLLVYINYGWNGISSNDPLESSLEVCEETLRPRIMMALGLSTIELFTSLVGLTRSKPHQVLLFSSVRTGVEILAAPLLPCNAWQHLWTVLCWSVGDTVRFSCFAIDALLAPAATDSGNSSSSTSLAHMAKSIRYTVGPLLFPFGAGGEMLMVIRAAIDGRPVLFLAASLWPAGFYPLMRQLLKQRKRHFSKQPGGTGSVKPIKKSV
mmetsp:Transcript_6302/g.9154  ORF Transcript_6302/g.9154 Transcript_6302/m.9154 type:complete len:227 (+) Transcript_6302:123-803(+)